MERHAIDASSAFEMLRERSRVDNRKLIDLVAAVVDGHRLLPKQPQAPPQPLTRQASAQSGRGEARANRVPASAEQEPSWSRLTR